MVMKANKKLESKVQKLYDAYREVLEEVAYWEFDSPVRWVWERILMLEDIFNIKLK